MLVGTRVLEPITLSDHVRTPEQPLQSGYRRSPCWRSRATGCASTRRRPAAFPEAGRPGREPAGGRSHAVALAAGDGYAIAGTALGLRGTPYRNGGSDPSGFDCSGFVWYVFGQHGIRVARTVGEQFREGVDVSAETLQPGDLLFFTTPGSGRVARRHGDRGR